VAQPGGPRRALRVAGWSGPRLCLVALEARNKISSKLKERIDRSKMTHEKPRHSRGRLCHTPFVGSLLCFEPRQQREVPPHPQQSRGCLGMTNV
jgi:hypothetical protein